MINISVQETIMHLPKNKQRSIFLLEDEIKAMLKNPKAHFSKQIPIKASALKGFCFDIRSDGLPAYGYMNGRYGVFIKREIHPHSGKFERGLILSPFGLPNDLLWVRETWRIGAWDEEKGVLAIDYKASRDITNTPWLYIDNDLNGERFNQYWVELSDELIEKGVPVDEDGRHHWEAGQAPLKWKSSAIIPKWASRLNVSVIDVKIIPFQSDDKDLTAWAFCATLCLDDY